MIAKTAAYCAMSSRLPPRLRATYEAEDNAQQAADDVEHVRPRLAFYGDSAATSLSRAPTAAFEPKP
jgi:hypothetical protein